MGTTVTPATLSPPNEPPASAPPQALPQEIVTALHQAGFPEDIDAATLIRQTQLQQGDTVGHVIQSAGYTPYQNLGGVVLAATQALNQAVKPSFSFNSINGSYYGIDIAALTHLDEDHQQAVVAAFRALAPTIKPEPQTGPGTLTPPGVTARPLLTAPTEALRPKARSPNARVTPLADTLPGLAGTSDDYRRWLARDNNGVSNALRLTRTVLGDETIQADGLEDALSRVVGTNQIGADGGPADLKKFTEDFQRHNGLVMANGEPDGLFGAKTAAKWVELAGQPAPVAPAPLTPPTAPAVTPATASTSDELFATVTKSFASNRDGTIKQIQDWVHDKASLAMPDDALPDFATKLAMRPDIVGALPPDVLETLSLSLSQALADVRADKPISDDALARARAAVSYEAAYAHAKPDIATLLAGNNGSLHAAYLARNADIGVVHQLVAATANPNTAQTAAIADSMEAALEALCRYGAPDTAPARFERAKLVLQALGPFRESTQQKFLVSLPEPARSNFAKALQQ